MTTPRKNKLILSLLLWPGIFFGQMFNARIINQHTEVIVKDFNSISLIETGEIQVMNKSGDHLSDLVFFHDKQSKYKKLDFKFYDKSGKLIRKVKKSDFQNISASDGFSLYNDGRLYLYDYHPVNYPYTIVYSKEKSSSNTAFLDTWSPVSNYNLYIQQASLNLTIPAGLEFDVIESNLPEGVVKNNTQVTKSYELNDFLGPDYEPLNLALHTEVPRVEYSLRRFELEGIEGTVQNWEEFGSWYYKNFLAGRNLLTEQEINYVRQQTAKLNSVRDKVSWVYKYMQSKTRYVSVQIGIGGWMPDESIKVSQTGYGDCKGLTNYTHALLEALDIPSYHTIIYGGSGRDRKDMVKEDFSMQGNHMILYVPLAEEDLWLECTSQEAPVGFLGDFTSDRQALVIYPDRAEFKKTTAYASDQNKQTTKAFMELDAQGGVHGTINIKSEGLQYDQRMVLAKKNQRDLIKIYRNTWGHFPNIEFLQLSISEDKEEVFLEEKLELSVPKYAKKMGSRMLLNINMINNNSYVPSVEKKRDSDFLISMGYLDKDEIHLKLPEGYTVEAWPKPVSINSDFGTYESSLEIAEDALVLKRSFHLKQQQYDAALFEDYRSFRTQVAKAEQVKIMLKPL